LLLQLLLLLLLLLRALQLLDPFLPCQLHHACSQLLQCCLLRVAHIQLLWHLLTLSCQILLSLHTQALAANGVIRLRQEVTVLVAVMAGAQAGSWAEARKQRVRDVEPLPLAAGRILGMWGLYQL